MNIAVLGYGYWGPNLVRNIITNGQNIKYVVDSSNDRCQKVKQIYPSVIPTTDINEAVNDTDVDAIVIALPVGLHHEVARKSLLAGKHVLVEKPMTRTVDEAHELIELALKKQLIFMPDHTFLYTGAVQKIKALVSSGELGDVLYFDSTRVNLGLFQSDISVLWDLAPHDLSILCNLINEKPFSVCATGKSHTENNLENMAHMSLFYQSDFFAQTNVSWVSPVKIRKILIGGTKKMIVYDDIEPTEKVKVYDSGFSVTNAEDENKIKVDYRIGDIYIPKLDMTEALLGMVADFVKAVNGGGSYNPISDMYLGASVVSILEAADKSLKNNGAEVKI